MAQPLRPSGEPAPPKPKVARSRREIRLDHLAVRTRDGLVTQYPEAVTIATNDDDDLTVFGQDEKILAFIRSHYWDEVFYPGTLRVTEVFVPTYYDAEGNEVESDEDL